MCICTFTENIHLYVYIYIYRYAHIISIFIQTTCGLKAMAMIIPSSRLRKIPKIDHHWSGGFCGFLSLFSPFYSQPFTMIIPMKKKHISTIIPLFSL